MKWTIDNEKWKIKKNNSQLSILNCQFQKGLTLVEVLVASAIAAVVGGLLLVIIVNSAGIFTQQSSKVTEGLNINDAFTQIRGSVKQANSVASSYTIGPNAYTSGPDQLILKVVSIDSAGNIIDSTYDYFIFFLAGTSLHFKISPDPSSFRKPADSILSTAVDTLVFTYLNSATPPQEVLPPDATKIRISLNLKQKIGPSFEVSTATSEANLRND